MSVDPFDVVKRRIGTEKTAAMESGGRHGFVVDARAGKRQVRAAVETIYGVRVAAVRTSVLPGRLRRAGKGVRKTSSTKKAYVQLREGHSIAPPGEA